MEPEDSEPKAKIESPRALAQSPAYQEYLRYLEAWHEDRLRWIDLGMKSLLLVNSGGIVAVAAFVGASLGTGGPPWLAYVSGFCFAAGLLLPIWYQLQRMADAEDNIKTLKKDRRQIVTKNKFKGVSRIDEEPPTRPQMKLARALNYSSFVAFILGLVIAFFALVSIAYDQHGELSGLNVSPRSQLWTVLPPGQFKPC